MEKFIYWFYCEGSSYFSTLFNFLWIFFSLTRGLYSAIVDSFYNALVYSVDQAIVACQFYTIYSNRHTAMAGLRAMETHPWTIHDPIYVGC